MTPTQRRLIAAVLAAVAAAVIVVPTLRDTPAPPADAAVVRQAVAAAVAHATVPFAPIVVARAARLADRDGQARIVQHECILGRRAVPMLVTVTWAGSVVYALRPETHPPGCRDLTRTLPLAARSAAATVVEIPIGPDGLPGVYASFTAGGAG